ncbi:MAG: (Fe-S)-binding protein [Thermoplasmata archaeon]
MEVTHAAKLKKEMMTCTACGTCKAVCPAYDALGWDSACARGRVLLAYGLLVKEIEPDRSVVERLYQCMTCNRCTEKCPSKVTVLDIIENIRKDLYEKGHCLPAHKKMVESIIKLGNPFGETKPRETHGRTKKNSKTGYFMGCLSGYREHKIAKSTMNVLDKLKIDFTILDEVCCGSPLARVGGAESELKKLVEKNVKAITDAGLEKVVFSCAGCYRMFKLEYPKFTKINFKVEHVSETLYEAITNKKVELKNMKKIVTYHDPCHLGRHAKVYDAPREVIKRIPGITFKEMQYNRSEARCCGGGGGVRAAFSDLAEAIASTRTEEAKKIADLLITSCPFCVNNLKKGDKTKIEIKDLVEVVDELL